VQKGKQLDIQSPVSGTITARNERLVTGTDVINNSPYNEGWIYTIEPDNWIAESRMMIMAGKYIEWIRDEFRQIKDFLAGLPDNNNVRYATVVLQDGGELKDGLLEEFGPEVWEDFQDKFLK
jgi:glycine cleavage system H protein